MLVWILFPLGCVAAFVGGVFLAALLGSAARADLAAQCATCYETLTAHAGTVKGGRDAHSGRG